MKTKIILPFFILFCTLSLVTVLNSKLFAKTSASLSSEQLSDHNLTVSGSILDTVSAATQNAAHLAWIEPITQSFGSPTNWGLFYRSLPNGSTINLTAVANASGNPWSPFIQTGESDNVCVVWRDQLPGGDYYLFLWNSALDTVTRSPNPVNGNGGFTYLPFTCDIQNSAKVVWYSKYTNTEITLWDLASGQQTRISNNSNVSIQSLHMAEINDVLYLAWPESGSIYLWDSISETAQEIDSSGFASSLFMYSDKNDVIHMFWLLAGFMGPPCHRYWNSVDQTNNLLMACDDWSFAAEKDGAGNIHAAWAKTSGPTPIRHWNVTENITSTISIQDQAIIKMNLVAGPDNKAHIFWQDFVTNDLYYWNSTDKVPTEVSDATFYIQDDHKWKFDSTGQIHNVWGDDLTNFNNKHVYYWNPSLAAPIKLTDTSLFLPEFLITVDIFDKAHVVFAGQPDQTLQYWNEDMLNPITTSTYPTLYLDGFTASNEDIYALYRSANNELNYWNNQDGKVSLGIGDRLSYILDGNVDVYLHWVATGFIEQEDMFAAWDVQGSKFIYLPFVVSD